MRLVNRLLGRRSDRAPYAIFGGIATDAYKTRSLRSRLMPVPIPEKLVLPLSQNLGVDAIAIVEAGDLVQKFQLLAEAGEPGSVALHAPTSGLVSSISNATVADEFGSQRLCIHLQSDGENRAIETVPEADYRALDHLQLLERIERAGICGLGGAGFPSAQKLSLGMKSGIDLLIINAVECEPFISADEALIRERGASVVVGAEILKSACLASNCIIVLQEDRADAIEALKKALENSSIELMTLAAGYPVGGEKQIIQAVTGMEVPSHAYPASIGVLVFNAGTAYAVYKAIADGEPCVSRITTLTGAPLQTPKNFETLIGTSVSFLFDLCGIDTTRHTGTIVGGPLMGIQLPTLDVPVMKTSNCLIAMSAAEFPPDEPELACIRCGFCAEACPARLLPQQLYAFSRAHDHEQNLAHGLFDCIECGACAYVCPSHIPLVQYYRSSKAEIRAQQRRQLQSQHWQRQFQQHQYRIKKQQDEAPHQISGDAVGPLKDDEPDKKNRSREDGDKTEAVVFSRERAKREIAEAVARVRARKAGHIASPRTDAESDG